MVKLLATVLVLVALVGGAVYYSNNQTSPTSLNSLVNQVNPNKSSVVTTDEVLDSDLTALEKDLADLEQSDTTLTNEVNGL
jgi:hypothetical protein